MFERLSSSEGAYRQVTQQHINEYADAGLRTLVLAYRELEEDEYAYFDRKFTAAKNSVSADRDEKIEEAADLLERDLILLGATAVEDKLQKGVRKIKSSSKVVIFNNLFGLSHMHSHHFRCLNALTNLLKLASRYGCSQVTRWKLP
jgi:hypothetical protein